MSYLFPAPNGGNPHPHQPVHNPLEVVFNTLGKTNFTDKEKIYFVGLVEAQKDIIESKINDNKMIEKKDAAWKEIAEHYNSQPGTHKRTPKQLKALWKNLKAKAKNDARKTRALEETFSDGSAPEYVLSALMQKVISVILSVHEDNMTILDDVFSASSDGMAALPNDAASSPSQDSGVRALPNEIVVIQPSEAGGGGACGLSTENQTEVKIEPMDNSDIDDRPAATTSPEASTPALASDEQAATPGTAAATPGENTSNVCKKRPGTNPTGCPPRKRTHTELLDSFERRRMLDMEKEEHEQRMKNMKLEAEVLELKRIKLQKQIAVLSNLNMFNMVMQ